MLAKAAAVLSACLTLAGPASAQTAPANPLTGTTWIIDRVDGRPVVAGTQMTMTFDAEGRVGGRAACNRYTASYTIEGERLTVSPAAATRMACLNPDLARLEALFLEVLQRISTWELDAEGRLTLRTSDGGSIKAGRAT